MRLDVRRQVTSARRTRGVIGIESTDPNCFTLEDAVRDAKIPGETAIPAGEYACRPREAGHLYGIYSPRWSWHRGMIHLQDVPNFDWIYIHAGVTVKHTEGCILVGYQFDMQTGRLAKSRVAYADLYRSVVDALYRNELSIRLAGD